MCQESDNTTSTSTAGIKRSNSRLLLSHDSFLADNVPDKDDENKRKDKNPHIHGLGGPSLPSTLLTVAFYVAILFLIEYLACKFIGRYAHLDPVLQDERNLQIISRHLGVDFLSLIVCGYIAVTNRHACREIIQHALSFGKSDSMHDDGFEERVFAYHPGAQRLMTLFFVYQVKNMYDTIYWNDGLVFVFHHLFAGAAAWVS